MGHERFHRALSLSVSWACLLCSLLYLFTIWNHPCYMLNWWKANPVGCQVRVKGLFYIWYMYIWYYVCIYIIITVTWSEVTDHVKLTGTDHHIKFDLEIHARQQDVIWHCRSSYCNNEKFIIYQVLSTLSVNIWDQLFNMFIYWRKHSFERTMYYVYEQDLWICTSLLCNFKADLETSTWNRFCTERCKWCQNTSRICFGKNIVYYTISFKEGWYEFRKLQCSDT